MKKIFIFHLSKHVLLDVCPLVSAVLFRSVLASTYREAEKLFKEFLQKTKIELFNGDNYLTDIEANLFDPVFFNLYFSSISATRADDIWKNMPSQVFVHYPKFN